MVVVVIELPYITAMTSFLREAALVGTPSMFAATSTPARATRDLSRLVLGVCAVIFVVAGRLIYSIVRFRRRSNADGHEPPQVYGSNQIELPWTVVPRSIVVVLFLATAHYIFGIEGLEPKPEALTIMVVGHQLSVGHSVQVFIRKGAGFTIWVVE